MPKVFFKHDDDEADSTWTVQTTEGEYSVSISDLFPSGRYDVHEVRSEEFGLSLLERLQDNPGDVIKYLTTNIRTTNVSDAMGVLSGEDVIKVVGSFIPLNDSEREFRDELKEVCRGG